MQSVNDPNLNLVLDGRYELKELIAEGGMGQVYKALQRSLDRVVAVKLLKASPEEKEEFQRRFFLEASLCARLTHPNTVRIFDYGCHDNETFYIVMEYLKGTVLSKTLREQGALSESRASECIKQACLALAEAHATGLVHRDLKPANLLLVEDKLGGNLVKLLDFGIVKEVHRDSTMTQQTRVLGSPCYMSPEQAQGQPLDSRSDIYALGVILFELLAGRPPFGGSSPVAVLTKHVTQAPPKISEVSSRVVSPALEDIVRRAMCKSPDDRFATTVEMYEALSAAQTSAEAVPKEDFKQHQITQFTDVTLHHPSAVIEPPESLKKGRQAAPQQSVQPIEGLVDGYRAYVDLNCPYCYALFERIFRWGLAEQIEWCLVEHAGHVLEGGFDLRQEEMLTNEVFEVHHRAPDIELKLPATRCRSTLATQLIGHIHRLFPEKVNRFTRATYRSLWRDGHDIGDPEVLISLLRSEGLPSELLTMAEKAPRDLIDWQTAWEEGEFDASIPVLLHPETQRVLIGLPDQSTLAGFLGGAQRRVVDRTVCFYQRKPSLLLCGWMSHLWPLLAEAKDRVEVLQAPTARRTSELLRERAVPSLLIIEDGHLSEDEFKDITAMASSRSVPWLVAAPSADPNRELAVLSGGAIEYLAVDVKDPRIIRARLGRLLEDRFRFTTEARFGPFDPLTGLPTRRVFLERLEQEWARSKTGNKPLSLVLLNLDRFKAYNRAHGYLSGDSVLVDIASNLRRTVGGLHRYLARFSGNEFALLLLETEETSPEVIAKQMREIVADLGVRRGDEGVEDTLRASTGVFTATPAEGSTIYRLVDGADAALRQSRITQSR